MNDELLKWQEEIKHGSLIGRTSHGEEMIGFLDFQADNAGVMQPIWNLHIVSYGRSYHSILVLKDVTTKQQAMQLIVQMLPSALATWENYREQILDTIRGGEA